MLLRLEVHVLLFLTSMITNFMILTPICHLMSPELLPKCPVHVHLNEQQNNVKESTASLQSHYQSICCQEDVRIKKNSFVQNQLLLSQLLLHPIISVHSLSNWIVHQHVKTQTSTTIQCVRPTEHRKIFIMSSKTLDSSSSVTSESYITNQRNGLESMFFFHELEH